MNVKRGKMVQIKKKSYPILCYPSGSSTFKVFKNEGMGPIKNSCESATVRELELTLGLTVIFHGIMK